MTTHAERAGAVTEITAIRTRRDGGSETLARQIAESDVNAAEDNEGVFQDDVIYVCWTREGYIVFETALTQGA